MGRRRELTRRHFLKRSCGAALVGNPLSGWLGGGLLDPTGGEASVTTSAPSTARERDRADAWRVADEEAAALSTSLKVPSWAVDATGDGVLDAADRKVITASMGTARGKGLRPEPGYDYRADLLGRGKVDDTDLQVFERQLRNAGPSGAVPPRPLLLAWHYGWYHHGRRPSGKATVRYLVGPYRSRDPRTEEAFNALKDEFGITVDMLSWINDARVPHNYDKGYFGAPSQPARRFGLLYESVINLETSERMDFSEEGPIATRFVKHFRRMGELFTAGRKRLRPGSFTMDGRPVIYLFASHMYGTSLENLVPFSKVLREARDAFADVTGAHPYLIGDEALFPSDQRLSGDRAIRAKLFDAITRYHHYDRGLVEDLGGGGDIRLDAAYRKAVLDVERRTMKAFQRTHNEFTGAPLLVIPSSAAGCAKRRFPAVSASREDFAAYLAQVKDLADEYIAANHADRLGTSALPAPIVNVGSWNEEFEGHALMPFSRNSAVHEPRFDGFDWLFALKAAYGWNHHSKRRHR